MTIDIEQRFAALEVKLAAMTEKVAVLETRLTRASTFTDLFTLVMSNDGRMPGIQVNANMAWWSKFWLEQPYGQGYTLSVGQNNARGCLALYVDGVSCPDHPTVGLYIENNQPNAQPNHALEIHCANGRDNYAIIADNHLVIYDPTDPSAYPRRTRYRWEGLQLAPGQRYLIGPDVARAKVLWP